MKSRRMTLRLAVLLGAVLLLVGIALAGTGQAQTSQPQPTPAPFPTPSARKDLSVEQLVRQSGCLECHGIDQKITGPSFRDMAARYRGVTAGYDLTFMAVAGAGDLPQKRKASVVVALLGDALHVRIFDPNGNIVVDRDEAGLVRGPVLADLKQRLIGGRVPDAAALSPEERQKILQGVFAAAGYSPARDILIDHIKQGSKGQWTDITGGVPMPPYSLRLSDFDIARIVDWVLTPFGPAGVSPQLKVMKLGLGSGTVISSPAGIACGSDCDETYASPVAVTLTAAADPGSTFVRWEGDCTGASPTCTVTMNADRSVRAFFDGTTPIPILADFTPAGIQTYLTANPTVNTPARFLRALPPEFRQNWLLMSRSESLQTGTATSPRILLPSADARFVFTIGLTPNSSYPGADPNAIEYMQWDATEKNFRFHEIVLDAIPQRGVIPPRSRGISVDDARCSKCHSTQNVLDRSGSLGTTGIPPGTVKAKNKPNWDAYDSWGGMLAFNRDRIYQGSVEAAAFRKIFNPWTWRSNDAVRAVIEQLELQPPGIPPAHAITRMSGGTYDGYVSFAFDASVPVLTEPAPTGSQPAITTNYTFNNTASGPATSVERGGAFITLHHSNIPTSDEGRGVRLFDALGGLAGSLNQQRVADELTSHRFATGSVPIDVRPVALAITMPNCLTLNPAGNTILSPSPLTINLSFFDARNGMNIAGVLNDTRSRAQNLPRRKADIQKIDADRSVDPYLVGPENGLIQQYGAATSSGTSTPLSVLRQEVFRRPIDLGSPDSTGVMGGVYVDREDYTNNTNRIALYRYFLEPLGVSVDRWSMGVRGRSRTYTFADVFSTYANVLQPALEASLTTQPVPGLSAPFNCPDVVAAVNSTLSSLPGANDVPTFTDVQRIFNKSCIECHGGLDYPPYSNYGTFLDLSEDETSATNRLGRSYGKAVAETTNDPLTSSLYQRIVATSENCPFGMMPCGGPALSKTDTETIRRWIVGARPNTVGDPHVKTIGGINYDFQAAGEFVLLRDEGFEIQARQTAVETEGPLGPNAYTGLTSCVSINTAAAVRAGAHRITYEPDLSGKPNPEGLQLRVDGELVQLSATGVPLGPDGRIIRTPAQGGIQIEGAGGAVVTITPGWWDYYQLWYLNIDTRSVRATQGIMGAIAPGNWLPALPDGSFLGPMPADLNQRYSDLYDKFGKSWRVSDATTLFDYAPGASTGTFTLDSWPLGESPKDCVLPPGLGSGKPPMKTLPAEVAKQVCSNIASEERRAFCEQDVMVTGEAGFAKTYLETEAVGRNAIPSAPVLVSPEPFATGLAGPITFAWREAKDPDQDKVLYRLYVWPVDETPDNNKAVPVPENLSYTISRLEPGRAYFWKVIAEDGKGGTVESQTRRFEMK